MEEYKFHCKRKNMERILEVRYTNLEESKSLCLELIDWAKPIDDGYGLAFGYTYLGDYYIAQNNWVQAYEYLKKAKNILDPLDEFPALTLRLLTLTAICYEMQQDQQSSIQCYMEAIVLAKHLEDRTSEGLIYNNLALAYQKHNSNEKALAYFLKAYETQKDHSNPSLEPLLLSNLVELLLAMDRQEEALVFLRKCEESPNVDPRLKKELTIRNWCYYYSTIGEKEKSAAWAEKALQQIDLYMENKFSVFENFNLFFNAMIHIGNKEYAEKFLNLLTSLSKDGGADQRWDLEVKRMDFCLRFDTKDKHLSAYRQFYTETQQLKKTANLTIVNAMKGQIALDHAISHNEALLNQQESLEKQADIDELSQVYTRGYFERLMRSRDKKDFAGKSLGIVMIDIDYFKEYNDFYGHLKGDRIIEALGECMLKNSGNAVYPCRYGGDEFAALIDYATEEAVETFILGVRQDFEKKALPHEKSLCSSIVTLSIGYAIEEIGEKITPDYLMQLADQALYRTKLSGRNGFVRKRAGEI